MVQAVQFKIGLVLTEDVTLNDSDKSFVVPAEQMWEVLSVRALLATTVVAGARQMAVEVQGTGGEILGQYVAGATQIENLTNRYTFAPGLTDQNTRRSSELTTPLPSRLILGPAMILRVYDIAAIDAAADDLEVRILANRREA